MRALDVRIDILWMCDILKRQSKQLISCESKHPRQGFVDVEETEVRAHEGHSDRRFLEDPLQVHTAFRRRVLYWWFRDRRHIVR